MDSCALQEKLKGFRLVQGFVEKSHTFLRKTALIGLQKENL